MIETVIISIPLDKEEEIELVQKSELFIQYAFSTEDKINNVNMYIIDFIKFNRLHKINKIQNKNINLYKNLLRIIDENTTAYMKKGDNLWSLHDKYKKDFQYINNKYKNIKI